MRRRWKRILLTLSCVGLVLPLLLSRFAGVVLQNADGRTLGYSSSTGEWLALDHPAHPASIDGPYLLRRDGRRELLRLERDGDGGVQAKRTRFARRTIEVEVDGATPQRFRVPLRSSHPRAPVDWPMPSRLFVASDFEGEFAAFATLLQANGVLDAQLHWRFGDGRLVLVGDLVDRGPNVVPLLWLVYRMEAEAAAAGGGVHYILGNHEQMLVTGRTSYLHPKYFGTLNLARESHAALWDEHSELGRWLRSKPVLLKVGDWLFMHGGVSPAVLEARPSLADVDRAAAAVFATPPDRIADRAQRLLIWDRDGLLWYRGLAMPLDAAPKADAAHVTQVLQHFGVRHLAIGHSLAQHVGTDYGGAVLRVDVHHASGTIEGVLIEGGQAHRVDARGTRSPLQAATNLE
jgi:hypothetical protein